jgi:hypothetical protein
MRSPFRCFVSYTEEYVRKSFMHTGDLYVSVRHVICFCRKFQDVENPSLEIWCPEEIGLYWQHDGADVAVWNNADSMPVFLHVFLKLFSVIMLVVSVCESRIFEIESRKRIVHLDSNVNFSFSGFENILISNKCYKTIGPRHWFGRFVFLILFSFQRVHSTVHNTGH